MNVQNRNNQTNFSGIMQVTRIKKAYEKIIPLDIPMTQEEDEKTIELVASGTKEELIKHLKSIYKPFDFNVENFQIYKNGSKIIATDRVNNRGTLAILRLDEQV